MSWVEHYGQMGKLYTLVFIFGMALILIWGELKLRKKKKIRRKNPETMQKQKNNTDDK